MGAVLRVPARPEVNRHCVVPSLVVLSVIVSMVSLVVLLSGCAATAKCDPTVVVMGPSEDPTCVESDECGCRWRAAIN